MKKNLLALFLLISGFIYGQNGLECIVVEKYYVSDANDATVNADGGVLPVGSVTYRIYADMLPGYTFQAAYGIDVAPVGTIGSGDHELRLQTSTYFFNNEDRGATTPNFTKARCAFNTVMLDSWLSAGAAAVGNFGILKSKDDGVATVVNADDVLQNAAPSAGIPLTQQDGLIAGSPQAVTTVGITNEILVFDNQNDGTNGPVFATYNGSWACLGGAKGPDTVDNKVLIAQITTDGIFTYELNLQIGTPEGNVERYVARNPIGAEISLPCLIDTLGAPLVPPTVAITSPSNNAAFNVGNTVDITASATAPSGTVRYVEFFVDGNSIGADSTAPYSKSWTAVVGSHNLTAKVIDDQGGQTTSSAVAVTVSVISGVNEVDASQPVFSVFPNPTNGQLQLQVTATGKTEATYTIVSINGSIVANKNMGVLNGNHTESINVSALAAGVYFVQVSMNGFVSTQKLVKN